MSCPCGGGAGRGGGNVDCGCGCRCGRPRPRRLIRLPVLPVGELSAVIYRARPTPWSLPRSYIHFFDRCPTLAASRRGTQLYIVGGRYRLGARGIYG